MKQLKRLLYYLLINMFVSACTTLAVLTYWERTHPAGLPSLDELSRLAAEKAVPLLTPARPQLTQAMPEPLPSATTRPLTTYTTRPGDTLGAIALEFGTTVEDLVEINHLDDPSALGSGQVLFVPGQLPTETGLTVETTQVPPDASQPPQDPMSTPLPGGLVVIANVFGVGDLATERVRLERQGEGEISLAGWQLHDSEGNVFTFPQLTLFPGGAVDVYSGPGVNGVTALYLGLRAPLWSTGDTATLIDQQGNEQAVFLIP